MADRLLGAHMPTSGGFGMAVRKGKELGCTAIQVFTASPRQWNSNPVKEEAIEQFINSRIETGLDWVISHDSYLINLAAPDDVVLNRSIGAFTAEMLRCASLKIPYVVTHMGSHLGQGEEFGLNRLSESVGQVLKGTPPEVSIALETTAGQGTNLGYRFEHLAHVIDSLHGDPRLVVCMDTCHIFAAGYDIRERDNYEAMVAEFDRLIGLNRLVCIHTNDSQREAGSRIDRHAHIGEGQLGLEAFRMIINDSRLMHAPMIIETPSEARFVEDLATLRNLIE